MLRLNLIGAGQVGKTLAYLFTQHANFTIGCVLNRTLASAQNACDFFKAGCAIQSYEELTPADCYLITVPDDHIADCTEKLVAAHILAPQNLVIHTSGFLPSNILSAATSQGALIASVHPVKSFANVVRSVETFKGTFCAVEGDVEACRLLTSWLEKIGAVTFPINASEKTIYHSAFILASNYLVVLYELGLQALKKSGVPDEISNPMLASLMSHTVEQSRSLGPTKALTGPIRRGDAFVVEAELKALLQWDSEVGNLYRDLGKIALQLAKRKGLAEEKAEKMAQVLS